MSVQSVASRYAKSLLWLAKDQNIVETVFEDMTLFAKTCEENHDLVLALKSPIVKHYQKLSILSKIFKDKVNPATFAIFEIITQKNRERLLPDIAEEFDRQYLEWKLIQKAEVTTVTPLTEAQRAEIIKIVSENTGKKVDLSEKIDPSLIGGYILRVDDRQIDTSVKTKLNDLKLVFTQS
ncbi:ATP synthase F1 subcomplex delta subunit [Pseudarcicella hirudinis]|uniref:ATP synthase subunit delta n=1 Tax=Pseudarcicella hirudinis TaxID=1079859 RepID=A0A1I5UIN1_9BACT|nr:ATP synthase F1 subunit delta [Pseudarcicella hirudinis]SFP95141.1 ATP synthase F1 subcomplex delta subunit [Pseudarcicella hirudinis]